MKIWGPSLKRIRSLTFFPVPILAVIYLIFFTFPSVAFSQEALTVTKVGTGTGTVTSSPAGIDCGVTCSAQFDTSTDGDGSATSPAPEWWGGITLNNDGSGLFDHCVIRYMGNWASS